MHIADIQKRSNTKWNRHPEVVLEKAKTLKSCPVMKNDAKGDSIHEASIWRATGSTIKSIKLQKKRIQIICPSIEIILCHKSFSPKMVCFVLLFVNYKIDIFFRFYHRFLEFDFIKNILFKLKINRNKLMEIKFFIIAHRNNYILCSS